MSSSQQNSNNSNTNQSQNRNLHQFPSEYLNEYEDYSSIPMPNNDWNNPETTQYVTANDFINQSGYHYPNNDDDDIPSDLEAEMDAAEEALNQQMNSNDEDEAIYSDAVQNAFSNYENEYSKYWKRADSTWNEFPIDEQDEMFEQMRECMRFMSQEYTTAEMPENLVERTQESVLNPDAVEFRPSWLPSSTSTDNQEMVVTSLTPCAAKKQDDEQNDS